MNSEKLWRAFGWILIIIGIITIISLICFLISKYTNIDLVIVPFLLALLSISLGIISLHIALKSGEIAEESLTISEKAKEISEQSKERMDTIKDAEIQQCIISIQEIRKEYLYGIQEYLFTPIANKKPINLSHLQYINIFTTWLHLENIRKALIYKDYMTDAQQLKLFRVHRTILDIVINNWQHQIVSNESISQLLTGISIVYENLEDTRNFREKYYEILNEYVGWIEPKEEFLEYITRIKRQLKQRGFYVLFEPFQ